MNNVFTSDATASTLEPDECCESGPLAPLMRAPARSRASAADPVLFGARRPGGFEIARLAALTGGTAWLTFARDGETRTAAAATVVDLAEHDVGAEMLVAFAGEGDAAPIVVGRLRATADTASAGTTAPVTVEADGRRIVVSAQAELVMRCGRASITLTEAGKVIIQGDYVSSRSVGVNRIKGGSVQIN